MKIEVHLKFVIYSKKNKCAALELMHVIRDYSLMICIIVEIMIGKINNYKNSSLLHHHSNKMLCWYILTV